MANEWDRQIIPELMQTTFALSLGVAYQSVEMAKHPQKAMDDMSSELKTLFTLPDDAGESLQQQAQAVAAVWMERGVAMFEKCKAAGRKFTEGE